MQLCVTLPCARPPSLPPSLDLIFLTTLDVGERKLDRGAVEVQKPAGPLNESLGRQSRPEGQESLCTQKGTFVNEKMFVYHMDFFPHRDIQQSPTTAPRTTPSLADIESRKREATERTDGSLEKYLLENSNHETKFCCKSANFLWFCVEIKCFAMSA